MTSDGLLILYVWHCGFLPLHLVRLSLALDYNARVKVDFVISYLEEVFQLVCMVSVRERKPSNVVDYFGYTTRLLWASLAPLRCSTSPSRLGSHASEAYCGIGNINVL